MMLSNGKTCLKCGAVATPDSAFCIECGTRFDTASAQRGLTSACAVCGATLAIGDVFCTSCGAPVEVDDAMALGAGARMCPKCSSIVGDDDDFCIKCGAQLGRAVGEQVIAEVVEEIPQPVPEVATPRIFNGNEDDSEADRKMSMFFYAPGDVD